MPKNIILASASPRRIELLKKIVGRFKVIPSRINEAEISALSPRSFAIKAAAAKAEDIAAKHKNAIVIGADTIVVLGNKIIGKPKNKKDAVRILGSLAGKTHRVITGLAVINTKTSIKRTHCEVTSVTMKKVKNKEIMEYVNSGRPLDKAGAYGIQEIEDVFIARIAGDYDNVVGLPVRALKKLLRSF
ncbi:MAG: Maf family protein [Candidatus Margulisbacteria bacterium]|nr:Maf family protein [Candidatus Margulisiibacteriota bacterium]